MSTYSGIWTETGVCSPAVEPRSSGGPWRAVAVSALVALLGLVATTAADPLGGTAHVAALGAAAVFVLGSATQRGARARGWAQVGTGLACWTVAGALAVIEAAGGAAVPAVVIGVVYGLGVLPTMVGLASLGAPLDADRHLSGMLDWALLFTLAFGLMWRLAVEPVALDATLAFTDRTLAALLPAADIALVMLAARAVSRRVIPTSTGVLVLVGFVLVASGDLVRLARYGSDAQATTPGALWAHLAGVGLVAGAAVHDRGGPRTMRLPPLAGEMAPRWISMLVASIASVPPTALILVDVYGERSARLTPSLMWLAVVALLVAWRGLAAHRVRRRAAERLAWLASHDVVTGAYRTHTFLDLTANRSARDRVGTVLALDLGGLAEVRDEHGTDVADLALLETAQRIRQSLADGAMLARTRDDELVAFVRSSDLHRGRAMAEAVRAAMRAPVVIGELALPLVVSVGVAQTDGAVIDVEAGVRRASAAMRHACTVSPGGVAIDAELAGAL